ncbi:MAG: transposase, partial [Maricaulis sp.]|uniref:integrase core domain-containing protein n=1 Tax=Maricaulis sp. TaxID=1486257 RepID=UPI001B25C364|nr:transposase [Maricaulis sp.]
RSSDSRNQDLARYLDWYNTGRPHYALNKQPPAKRLSQLNNVLRNDTYPPKLIPHPHHRA